MFKLLPIIFIALFLTFISDNLSECEINEYGERIYVKKERVVYFFMALCMALFVGLRTRGNDTYAYRHMYELLDGSFNPISILKTTSISSSPGLVLIGSFMRSIGASTQSYLMLFALFTVGVYLWFIRKYSTDIWLSIFYFITMGVYTFTMAAIKQTTAVALLLIATDAAIQSKWVRFGVFVGIAMLFRTYSFVYMVIPFLSFAPWSQLTYVLLLATAFISIAMNRLIGGVYTLTESLGYSYSEGSFSGVGVNIFRVAVVWVPLIISFLFRDSWRENDNREENIIINASMMCSVIMFIGLFGTANYFARLANYFLIFQCLALPLLFKYLTHNNRIIVQLLSIIGFAGYIYYSEVLVNGGFDHNYDFITVGQFFSQLSL